MSAPRLHADEITVDHALVRALVAAQFPQWAGLPLARVEPGGTTNAMYRLGDGLAVRLPRTAGAVGDVEREHRWLPRLAPHLPAAVPVPLGRGVPGEGYPLPWSVYRWLDGETVAAGRVAEPALLAADLAAFLTALHRIDPGGAPVSFRGGALADRDAGTRAAIGRLRGRVDTAAVTTAWEEALRAPAWAGPPVWIHADLQPGNVLVAHGRLGAVIDFGCLGLGDPAVDLIAAWYLLPAGARDVLRTGTRADGASWARGRGWALSIALDELWYYAETDPGMAGTARRVVGRILADRAHGGR
ncbi:aminoglycoside phosphotransferase family protein [Kitasatospora sp. NBC_01539]|uniref:aminoglycoside phosphotransferase family protein n=1 Tax=Kitasatospora sp. NBC_01539 TaxID=2903577 RepID=UPI0038600FD3